MQKQKNCYSLNDFLSYFMTIQSRFDNLGLNIQLQRAVNEAGYLEPTPIQTQTIPHILAGKDLIGCAQTGTGKTAAFALPILQKLNIDSKRTSNSKLQHKSHPKKIIRVLVLSPTRELAIQIGDFFTEYGQFIKNFKNTVIFGGVKAFSQIKALQSGVDVLTATPGRLLDLIGQGYVDLRRIEMLVFDEADRMLDMGFIHDVRRIMRTVSKVHQTMLFSATMPKSIVQLANDFLHSPIKVSVTPNQPTVEIIDQSLYFVSKNAKQVLLNTLLKDPKIIRALVFSRTKHGANKIVRKLGQAGIEAEPIHGNKSQNARQKALKNFREGTTRVLVATDVAARGIDVENISHVIQFDLPNVPETYVHRIGRTGRAGAGGTAIAFCAEEEKPLLKDIEKSIRMKIALVKTPKLIIPPRTKQFNKPRTIGSKKPASQGKKKSTSRGMKNPKSKGMKNPISKGRKKSTSREVKNRSSKKVPNSNSKGMKKKNMNRNNNSNF
jgi:ATP-dependent RNA helicase RhlE